MALRSKSEAVPQRPVFRARKFQSIKEAAGKHSGAEIHSLLRDVDRDPHDTAQRSLNRDPIYDVRWKDRRKESTGYRGLADTKTYEEHKVQWTKFHTSLAQNGRKGGHAMKFVPVVTQQFRIVRDNRSNLKSDRCINPDSAPNIDIDNKQLVGGAAESSSTGNVINENHPTARNFVEREVSHSLEGQFDSRQSYASSEFNIGDRQLIPELKLEACMKVDGGTGNNNEVHSSALASATMAIGMYSSISDPVHVPSVESRSSGAIEATRRQVGVVGSQRQTCIHPSTGLSAVHGEFSIHLSGKDLPPSTESFGHKVATPKTSSFYAIPASEPIMSSISLSRGFTANRLSSRPNQQFLAHQKATLSNMGWRPKSSQKSRISSPRSYCNSSFTGSIQVESADLSEKLAQINIFDGGHVIIPEHLRVPEADRIRLTFGSFGDGFDSMNVSSATFLACENGDKSSDQHSMRMSAPVPMTSHKNDSAVAKADQENSNLASPQSDSSSSTRESELALPVHSESSSPKNILSYADIDMVQCQDPSFSPSESQILENSPSLHCFLGYGQQTRDCAPFPKAAIDENAQKNLSLTSEALGFNTCIHQSSMSMVQKQQHPPVSQLYPPVNVSHFTNFVPYRHIMTPMYAPPIAVPVYSGNHADQPSPNGSSCLFMPGGNSNVAAGGLKFTAQQYKPVHAGSLVGYASYARPCGYTVDNTGAIVSAANIDDTSGFKYMDNGLYVPNPQVEASNIWLQTPREVPAVHPSPYDLSGQGATDHVAYQHNHHLGHAFHGGAHSSYNQYSSGSYHPSLPGSVTYRPHQLIHNQVPLPGGGAVVSAPGAPVASYPQPQLGHAGWTANF